MRPDDIIDLYEDYQEETILIGKGRIIEEKSEGLTFILDDMPKEKQIVYGTKRFLCEIIEDCSYPKGYQKTFNKRYTYNIGPTPLFSKEEFDIDEEDFVEGYPIQDNFLDDPLEEGKQIY